jgi:hypothetical protein
MRRLWRLGSRGLGVRRTETDGEFHAWRTEVRRYEVNTGAGDLVTYKSGVLLAVTLDEFF